MLCVRLVGATAVEPVLSDVVGEIDIFARWRVACC
jgi:hypothetical protein